MLLLPRRDSRDGLCDFARHKRFAAAGTFMVEQNPVATIDLVAFTINSRAPVSMQLGRGIRAAGNKGRVLILRAWRTPKHLRTGGLVKPCFYAASPDGFQHTSCSQRCNIPGIFWNLKTYLHVALRR